MTSAQTMLWREIHWPSDFPTESALLLLRRLASDQHRGPIIFETRAREGHLRHLLGCAAVHASDVAQSIRTLVPETILSTLDVPRSPYPKSARLSVRGSEMGLGVAKLEQTARGVFSALASARSREESATLQLVLAAGRPPRLTRLSLDPNQGALDAVLNGTRKPTADVVNRFRDRLAEPGFRAFVTVAASAKSEARRRAIMQAVLSALRLSQSPGTHMDFIAARGTRLDQLPAAGSLSLSASEVLALIAWPIGHDQLPGMPAPHPKLLRLRTSKPEETRVFGETNTPGSTKPVGISTASSLFHTVVTGPTGVGKSTLFLNLAVADMKAGRSVVIIDPKKDLVTDLLARIPESRRNDVVVLDPTQDAPAGLNPLAASGTGPELVADGVLGIFRELFPTAFGPRTSDVMHASLLTLARHPGATLTWLPRLLSDARFRRTLTSGLDDPMGLDAFWAYFDDLSDRQQSQHVGPVLSRLRQFLLRPTLRRVLDQSEPKFQLSELFTSSKILLVPLNAGLLGGEATRLLGSLLVSQLHQLTLARADTPQEERGAVSIYIDEAQEFLNLGGDLADALARSRALGVAWHLAHQYRAQMPRESLAAIDANARNKIVFTLRRDDASAMAAMAPELSIEDFTSLPPYAVYASLMHDGRQLDWVSASTLPPPEPTSDPAELLKRSHRKYGAPEKRQEVTGHPDVPPGPAPIGRRRRN